MSFRSFLAALALGLAVSSPLAAHEYKAGDLTIVHPWSRATPPGAPVAGGFMTITNTGADADRLVSASFEGSARVEIHEMTMEGDVMKMAELKDGLPIPPGATVALKPGSYHLMFMELKAPLIEHERIKGSLTFERAGSIAVEFNIEAMGEKGGAHGGQDHSGHGQHHTAPSQ
jgi:periplasmic copper chaperone A